MRSATEAMDQTEAVDHNTLGTSFARLQMLGYGKRVEQLKSPQEIGFQLTHGAFAGPSRRIIQGTLLSP